MVFFHGFSHGFWHPRIPSPPSPEVSGLLPGQAQRRTQQEGAGLRTTGEGPTHAAHRRAELSAYGGTSGDEGKITVMAIYQL